MKYFKYLPYFPILGVLVPYIYALICINESKTINFSYGDPAHYYNIGKYYNSFQIIVFLCLFCLIINFFILMFYLLLTREYKRDLKHVYIYIGIVLFLIIIHHFDPGHFIRWFFD